jgi:hypothetical protein
VSFSFKSYLTVLALLTTSRPADGKEGQFRFVLGGTEAVAVRIQATDILPIPEMEPFTIVGQFKPGIHIALQQNSTCSGWFDVADLVASQDLEVVVGDGEDGHEHFLEAVADCQALHSQSGLSWRWMLAAAADGIGLELHLQGLSCRGTAIQSTPVLCKDNVAAVTLAKYQVEARCFDGREAAGPVPVFLTSNPIDVAKQLEENQALAHGYCQALAQRILVPEELSSLEAMAYVQGPRIGKGETPFLREWRPAQQPPKKHKPAAVTNLGPIGDTEGINVV